MAHGSLPIPIQPDLCTTPAWTPARSTPRTAYGCKSVRLPGLFRGCEVADAIAWGDEFFRVIVGAAADGEPLFAVYARDA